MVEEDPLETLTPIPEGTDLPADSEVPSPEEDDDNADDEEEDA